MILQKAYGGSFRDNTDLASSNMIPIIEFYCPNEVFSRVNEIRLVEKSARNIAAHEITAINEKWVQDKTGMKMSYILSVLRGLIGQFTGFREGQWKSYDDMDAFILELLN